MAAAVVLGAVCGLSLLVAWRLIRPAPTPLAVALTRLQRHADASQLPDGDTGALQVRVGRWLRSVAETVGMDLGGLGPDLCAAGRSLERHLTSKALLSLVGVLLPGAWVGLVALGGVRVTLPACLGAAALLGVGGFGLPDLLLRAEAAELRRDFITALGSYLDLVVISLAGGAGVESALQDAAQVGHGWAFAQLRTALETTRLTGQTPWAAFSRVGDELGVTALGELAASVSLAGTEGARVRDSLAAKAASLRVRQLAEAEAEAQAATERMAVPTVLLLAGFMILIGYPALDAVLTGL